MEQQFKYKLAIAIMTRNRSCFVRELLRKMAKALHERNVGLYFFDGSDKDNLKYVIDGYVNCGCDNIHYFYYDPKAYKGDSRYINVQRGNDIREKVNAKYIWRCSDKLFPTKEGLDKVIEQLDKGYNIIVYNTLYQNSEITKEYFNKIDFFRDCTMKMQVLAAPILRYDLLKSYTIENLKYCIDKKKYTDIETILQGVSEVKNFKALLLCLNNEKETALLSFSKGETSTHVKNAETMKYFIEYIYNTINELPAIYDNEKKAVIKSISCNTWFSIEGFALLRAKKGYYFGQCMQYLDKIPLVTDVPIPFVLGISLLPPSIANILYDIICKYKFSKGRQCFGRYRKE